MITENLSTLKINKLTQEQYDRELAAGNIDENALYLTPDEEDAYSKKSYNKDTLPLFDENPSLSTFVTYNGGGLLPVNSEFTFWVGTDTQLGIDIRAAISSAFHGWDYFGDAIITRSYGGNTYYFYCPTVDNQRIFTATYRVSEQAWSPWYEISDRGVPMGFNVEYLTAERWNGLPVYKKIINFGLLPKNAVKSVTVFSNMIAEGIEIISYEGVAHTDFYDDFYITYTIPYSGDTGWSSHNITINTRVNDGNLMVITAITQTTTLEYIPSMYGYFTFKYIKKA